MQGRTGPPPFFALLFFCGEKRDLFPPPAEEASSLRARAMSFFFFFCSPSRLFLPARTLARSCYFFPKESVSYVSFLETATVSPILFSPPGRNSMISRPSFFPPFFHLRADGHHRLFSQTEMDLHLPIAFPTSDVTHVLSSFPFSRIPFFFFQSLQNRATSYSLRRRERKAPPILPHGMSRTLSFFP